ncbi:GNAT family N-acetyltransferase [bacterium]|nr:GNAT family N-acetyltransferase [bacterium]
MKSELTLRDGEKKDCKLLWEWRNEKSVREASFNSKYISYEEHKKWFQKKIKSRKEKISIIESEFGKEIGQVRFDFNSPGAAEVSIIIDKTERGKGYGIQALRLFCEHTFKNYPIKNITAHIKQKNTPSLRIFKKSGFTINRLKEVKGFSCYEMILERNSQKRVNGL